MKTRLLIIIIGIVVILGLSIFYLYTYYPSSYDEGIGLTIYKDPESYISGYKHSIYSLQEDDFEEIPKIKYMMDVLLTRDKTIGERRIIHHGPDNTRYEINTNLNEYSINVGMPSSELDDYNKWVESKSTYLLEYDKVLFQITNWARHY